MDLLEKLQKWYLAQCNGDWEHEFGIFVENLDNPGWFVRIDLEDTSLEEKHFEPILEERSDADWIQCEIKENRFEGMGGTFNLVEILEIFLTWAENNQKT